MNKIYLYTTDSDREKGYYKYGLTLKESEKRVRGQQTGNSEKLQLIFEKESKHSDHYVHNGLEERGYHRVHDITGGGREWFGGFKSDEEAVATLLEILSEGDNTEPKTYTPRFYQDYLKMVFEEKLESNTKEIKEFALELAPRFGKTLWSLDLMKTLFYDYGYKICLIPAYVLTALSSFKKEFYTFDSFYKEMIFVRENELIEDVIKQYYGRKMIILPISLHSSDFMTKYKSISDLPKKDKVSFIDESDFGCHRKNCQDLINFLGCGLNVYMTGTAIDKVVLPLNHIDDNIIRWSYTDMLMVKKGEHPIQNHLI